MASVLGAGMVTIGLVEGVNTPLAPEHRVQFLFNRPAARLDRNALDPIPYPTMVEMLGELDLPENEEALRPYRAALSAAFHRFVLCVRS